MPRGIHPNSLKNLDLPKGRKEGYGHYYSLPQPLIDKLFILVADEGMGLKNAAQKLGICFETAKKYYEQGDKRRGIKPLHRRLVVYKQKVSETFDKGLLKRKKELITLVQKAITKLEGQLDSGDLLKHPSLTQLDKLIRLEMFLSGQEQSREQELLTAEDYRAIEQSERFDQESSPDS